jgi:hypothetical protein
MTFVTIHLHGKGIQRTWAKIQETKKKKNKHTTKKCFCRPEWFHKLSAKVEHVTLPPTKCIHGCAKVPTLSYTENAESDKAV